MREQFTYAVARIRAKEISLLSEQDINRLMACKTYAECLNALRDKGWGTEIPANEDNYQALLAAEETKLWQLVGELVPDKNLFNVLLLPVDFHNLKAAIKGYITRSLSDGLFLAGGTVEKEHLLKCVEESHFDELPTYMSTAARLAFEKLLHTGDGQLCDNILDNALLQAIQSEGSASKSELIMAYSEFFVASSNIKVALRSYLLGKNLEFLKSLLVKCNSLDVEKLAIASLNGVESLCEYLEFTNYADAVPFVRESLQKFEFWRDNKIIELIRSERTNFFSISPIFAYILARQNEIKVVRIILSGKAHQIDTNLINERLRMMYA